MNEIIIVLIWLLVGIVIGYILNEVWQIQKQFNKFYREMEILEQIIKYDELKSKVKK